MFQLILSYLFYTRIIILVNLTVVHRGIVVGKKLGDPKPLEVGIANKTNQPPAQQPLQPAQNGGWGGSAPTESKPFYGSSPAPPPRPSSMGGGYGGAPSTNMSPGGGARRCVPIASLNPYQNK